MRNISNHDKPSTSPQTSLAPFNLQRAKAGEPLVRGTGRPMFFVAHDPEAVPAQRVICRNEWGNIATLYEDGRFFSQAGSEYDVFMAPISSVEVAA